jgi:hypothetical protein
MITAYFIDNEFAKLRIAENKVQDEEFIIADYSFTIFVIYALIV